MRNLVWAIASLVIIIIVVFVFTSRQKQSEDTVIPAQVLLNTPSPDISNINIDQKAAEDKKMQVPFQVLKKEEIEGKKATINTNKGIIVLSFDSNAPIAASNFIDLAHKKFYDGLIFHRVISGFMIQGGDPKGDGTGGPGYAFPDEPVSGTYVRGTVAMANAGPNTNGSQFFIMHKDYGLSPNYTIFGNVLSGIEVVDEIANAQVDVNDKPIDPIVMKSVAVE